MMQLSKKSINKLSVGFVIDDGLDSTDGVQQYVLTLGTWLTARGHTVHYFAGETKRTDIPNLHSMSRNLRVRFNGNTLSTPLPASTRHIRKVLTAAHLDVLHVQVPYSPFMAARILNRVDPNVQVVGTFHILPFGRMQSFGTRLLGLWLRRSLQRFDSFVSVSPAAQVFARSSFGVQSTVVPNSVPIASFRSKKPKNKTNHVQITFLGRLVRRKGCYELLRAIRYIKHHNLTTTKFHVDVYGKGPDLRRLELYVGQYDLQDTVSFHGYLEESNKAQTLAAADIAIFPSTGAESFGIVLIEAMASGSGVVLGGNNPGYASVLSEAPETLFDPLDTTSFARQLTNFIQDISLRARVHAVQQAAVRQYDTDIVASQLLELYCKKIDNR